MADHCTSYALSDPNESVYQSPCDHQHTEVCDRCEMLKLVLEEIDGALTAQSVNLSQGAKEELSFKVKQAKNAILAWKSHLLRSVNQDAARLHVLDLLDESSVLLVQDWAMKFLPRKYRESQKDWFGKRGLPWHVTVATRKKDFEYEMLTFIHIFPSCSQGSTAVIAVMSDVIKQLKVIMPSLASVYYRQDNAGCYHSGATINCARIIGMPNDVTIKRRDFSDPQGGKGCCDRKAATIKSHIRIHLNCGNDVEKAVQMKDAILPSGGVPAVAVTLCEALKPSKLPLLKIDGISFLNNMEYEKDGIRVWKAYGIGPGKLIPFSKVQTPSSSEIPTVDITSADPSSFASLKSRHLRQGEKSKEDSETQPNEGSASDFDEDATNSVFTCPDEGCTQTFLRHSSLQSHLDFGKHLRVLERETLLDRAIVAYSESLQGQTAEIPHLNTASKQATPHCSTPLPMGWALKSGAPQVRFTPSQKSYLTTKFILGEQSGQKADPGSVARAMMRAKDTSGNPLFTSEEYLTQSQIAGFFSHLASKKRLESDDDKDPLDIEDIEGASNEAQLAELTSMASQAIGLVHPISYDNYNLCDMSANQSLNKLSVNLLKEICFAFDVDTSEITLRRKQPYIDRIKSVCQDCTCQQ